jgi:hypothetical protein
MKLKLNYYFFLLLFLQCFLSSCLQKIILNSLGAFENTVQSRYITNGEKKIVFMPIHHIGKKIFYDDARRNIDSLMSIGYIVYFENVRMLTTDSLQKDTLYRKVRKITGVDFVTTINNKGYIDTINNTLLGKKSKYIAKYKLINQSKKMFPSFDSTRVKNVDADFAQLINACENKYGTILLDKYDYETKFGEKYKHKRDKELFEFFVSGFRNNIISNSIMNEKNDKIIVVYGGKHFKGILENLKAADKNYKEVESL